LLAIYKVTLLGWAFMFDIVTPSPAERVFDAATAMLVLLALGVVVERAFNRRPSPSEDR
jgi:hypothetical protein